jgi:hypothetical protein
MDGDFQLYNFESGASQTKDRKEPIHMLASSLSVFLSHGFCGARGMDDTKLKGGTRFEAQPLHDRPGVAPENSFLRQPTQNTARIPEYHQSLAEIRARALIALSTAQLTLLAKIS